MMTRQMTRRRNGTPVRFGFGWPQDVDQLLNGFFTEPAIAGGPRVDVRQEGEDLVVQAEVPGLSRDQIEVTVENGILTLAGKAREENNEPQSTYYLRERRQAEFSRSFRLPKTADTDNVQAALEHGILTLRIPTREDAKPRQIEVK